MKLSRKTLKICALVLLGLALVFFGYKKCVEVHNRRQAETLFAAGDYAGAKEWYEKNSSADDMLRCDAEMARVAYEEAAARLEQGEYEAARRAFEALDDYGDAAVRAQECDYREAQALADEGSFRDAAELLKGIPDYPGAPELLEAVTGELYRQALETTYEYRLDEAITLWNELGGYRDSETLLRRCISTIAAMAAGIDEPVKASQSGTEIGGGVLYWHPVGLIYIPKECNSETSCMIFYPGGYDTALANAYYQDLLQNSSPNAIIVFMYTNGYFDMTGRMEEAYAALSQAALESRVFPHDLVLCGASMGAYTAVNSAAYFCENYGLKAKYVLTFDAGMHWTVADHVLTPEECDVTAGAGTSFLLFEGAGIGMNKSAIHSMVRHGNDVTIVLCKNDGHYGIIYDAIYKGMIDWALGGEEVDDPNYTFIHLDMDSTYPD